MPNKNQKSSNPSILFIFIALVVVLGGAKYMRFKTAQEQVKVVEDNRPAFDYANHTFRLNNSVLPFVNGAYNSSGHTASMADRTTSPTGTMSAALLTDNPSGSGVFYYIVGGSMKGSQEVYSQPVLLGDRIKFESMLVSDDGTVFVEYLGRHANGPMAVEPTQKMSKKFSFQPDGNLKELKP
jgi:hypothetical protein